MPVQRSRGLLALPLKQSSLICPFKRARVGEEDTALPPAAPGPRGRNRQALVNTAVFGLNRALLIERVISAACCCYLCCALVVQNVNKRESWLPHFVRVSISAVLLKPAWPLPFVFYLPMAERNFCCTMQPPPVYTGNFTPQQRFNRTREATSTCWTQAVEETLV